MPSWFDQARFGMFIHWGHVSQRGLEISWPLVGGTRNLPHGQDVSAASYHETAPTFSPERGSPRRWLERAKRAGMRYAVFTTKHHDGYAMFDTRASDFSVARSAYRGHLVREYVEAARGLGRKGARHYPRCDWRAPHPP